MKRLVNNSLTKGKVSRSKFKDGANHAVKRTSFSQNSTKDER